MNRLGSPRRAHEPRERPRPDDRAARPPSAEARADSTKTPHVGHVQHARHGPPWTYMDMDSQVTAANEARTNVRIHPTPTRQEWTDLARVHDRQVHGLEPRAYK